MHFSTKEHYDLVFGIGSACSCSSTLRYSLLQFTSFPLDWLYGLDFSGRVDLLTSRFENFIDKKEDFVFTGEQNGDKNHPCDVYENKKTKLFLNHDFSSNIPFDESFPIVQEKYNRRIQRLINKLENAKSVLIVYIETPNCEQKLADNSILIEKYNQITEAFPNKKIDLMYFSCTSEKKDENISENIRKISCDYKDHREGVPSYSVDLKILYRFFKNKHVSAPLSQKIIAKYKLYRYGNGNVVNKVINKYRFKLYLHLEKKLIKSGVLKFSRRSNK